MKVLFISHEASRTGAPMVLLHLLKWLKNNNCDLELDLVLLNGGPLESEFKNVCDNFYNYYEIIKPVKLKIWQRILLKLGMFKKPNFKILFLKKLISNNYNVVYANTILSIPLAYDLVAKSPEIRFIAHLHELNVVIKLLLPNLDFYIDAIDQFITPATIVKNNLVDKWKVPAIKIDVVYECAIIQKTQKTQKSNDFFTIGAVGTVHWRKGHDVFIQVARKLCSLNPNNNFKFVWVGLILDHDLIIIQEDLQKLGLENKISFVGEVANPSDYYNDFDVFVMTSREDPFPLVCIEVGMIGIPIISFNKAVGTNEFLEKGGGFVVSYLDIDAMSEKIMDYYNNPALISEHGEYNEKIFSQFTPDIICPELFALFKKKLN